MAILSSTAKKACLVLLLIVVVDSFTVHSMSFVVRSEYPLEYYTPQPDFNSAYISIKKISGANDLIISPYPYMDKIYLNKSSYALPISYTGRDEDSTRLKRVEHYSGTKMLYWSKDINEFELRNTLKEKGTVFFILDGMARSRIASGTQEFISKNGALIFENGKNESQKIQVYRIDNM